MMCGPDETGRICKFGGQNRDNHINDYLTLATSAK